MKTTLASDKRKEVYHLTDKGLDLIPILVEMASWSAQHDPQTGAPHRWIALVNANKAQMLHLIRASVQRGGAIFVGEDSVVNQLTLEKGSHA